MWFLENAWLIPVIPTVGYFLILLFGKRMPLKGAEVGVGSLFVSFLIACGAVYQWIQRVDDYAGSQGGALGALASFGRSVMPAAATAEGGHEAAAYVPPLIRQWTWWQVSDVKFTLGIQIDGLSVTILFVVALIATLIQLYSIEYVRGDRRFTFFFSALTLFAAGMLCMVIAESTVQFILGWEIMGLCSFLLIGHWWEDYANARAALKAFFTVRVGDIGLLVGMSIMYFGANSWAKDNLGSDGFSIFAISGWALSGDGTKTVLLWGGVALFIAAIGKSGQFPLHTWLPDAMAGPTPVSALLHSSTMVVAGVYLVARLYPVFYTGFQIGDSNVNMIAVIGGITIIIAAVLAFVQVDIKRVLAYSTVSQLGYMMMGLGVGAWGPAVFHIFTHAFFKACLFLGAGSVSHSASHHSFDMKKDMGGLWRKMPITFATFLIATAALAGLPPLAGFFSKDEIIASAGANGYTAFQTIGLIGAFLTAAYMTRCVYLTFLGQPRGASAGLAAHGDEEHEIDDDRVLVDAGLVAASVTAHDLVGDDPLHGASAPAGGDHAAHDAHGAHGEHRGPHESNWLITVPLIILGFGALVAGFLNAPAFKTEKFLEWVEPAGVAVPYEEARTIQAGQPVLTLPGAAVEGAAAEAVPCGDAAPEAGACFAPELNHAEFKWSEAAVSIVLVLAGIAVSGAVCWAFYAKRNPRLVGLTDRSRLAAAGYGFLINKYYLDFLYERGVVGAISGPVARAMGWVNQNVIDRVVNGIGKGAVTVADATYEYLDQGLVDGAVNGAGTVTESTGEALAPVQSGKVSLYGALLFGAAAIGALILIIVVWSDVVYLTNSANNWLLPVGVFLPVVGIVVMLFIPKGDEQLHKLIALVTALATAVIGVVTLATFDYDRAGTLQFFVSEPWIDAIRARFIMGCDGMSLPLYILTMVITVLVIIYSWDHIPDPGNAKAFLILILILQVGMAGTFVAQDLILFFVFFEVVLLPMYFMIGVWGGEHRRYASLKFFLFTLFGSAFMLLGFIALFFKSGAATAPGGNFSIEYLMAHSSSISRTTALLIFGGMFLGFAIKVPMFPFHTWLPDAHTQAPTVGSVILAAILLKLGTYGFIRIAIPILPEAAKEWAPWIGGLAVIGIIYGALCCLAQTDMKRLIAFSSVSHMGFVMLGIATLTPFGFNAAIFGMVAHGLITGMLFFVAGSVKDRYHTLEISRMSGMLKQAPRLGWILGFCAMASLGLPGLAGFWGEFPAILSAYSPVSGLKVETFRIYMVIAAVGTVLAAAYLLWLYQRTAFGEPTDEFAHDDHIQDVHLVEWVAWTPMLIGILVLGVYPNILFSVMSPAVDLALQAYGE